MPIHIDLHVPPDFEILSIEWRNTTPYFVLPKPGNDINTFECESTSILSLLCSDAVPLC